MASQKFNSEFEHRYNNAISYSIADPKLREQVRQQAKEFVLPLYTSFHTRYVRTSAWYQHTVQRRFHRWKNENFAKNKSKYLKFHPDTLEEMLARFFGAEEDLATP